MYSITLFFCHFMNPIIRHYVTRQIKQKALELGFLHVGIAKAEKLTEEARHLEEWLKKGYQGDMSYMNNHFDKRIDPALLVPGAKSVISLAYNYYTTLKQSDIDAPKISMYAYGRDYHKVVKKKLLSLFRFIQEISGGVDGRVFVDSAPVMERDWAKKAGIAWTGKNTLSIHPRMGSYFFLGEIILDLELEYDAPIKDYCGTCRKCIDACPTNAIDKKGYVLDGKRCISYLTIELKNEIPSEFHDTMEGWMFGCDICQQVCPWNRFSVPHEEHDFIPKPALLEMTKNDWTDLTEDTFNILFHGSAVKRTGFNGLKKNISIVCKEKN